AGAGRPDRRRDQRRARQGRGDRAAEDGRAHRRASAAARTQAAVLTSDIDRLVMMLAKLPGLGPRSARRAALHLLTRKESVLDPLSEALAAAAANVRECSRCHNLDTSDPCAVCADPQRDQTLLCVVEQVADLWAIERTHSFKGRYHVLGGVLSPL